MLGLGSPEARAPESRSSPSPYSDYICYVPGEFDGSDEAMSNRVCENCGVNCAA